MAAIATEAGVPILNVYRGFSSKMAILHAFFRRIDEAVLATPVEVEIDERPRDRVFDLLMRQFDALQPYRGAIEVLGRELPRDPLAALAAGAGLLRSMAWMLEAAGISAGGLGGALAMKLTASAYMTDCRGLAARRHGRFRADHGGARPAATRHRALVWQGPAAAAFRRGSRGLNRPGILLQCKNCLTQPPVPTIYALCTAQLQDL